MKKRFVLSLISSGNDYQREQAVDAEDAALRLGIDLQIFSAENDAINQSQQLLEVIQGPKEERPDAIAVQPVGTGLAQVAAAAVRAGIAWVVINRDVDYIPELRLKCSVPIFAIGADQREIGHIQGRQLQALLPRGGLALYIAGPAYSVPAQQRTAGMMQSKPANVQIRSFKADWTEEGAYKAVSAWLRLSTSRQTEISVIMAQNDFMARGAKKAFQQETSGAELERWMNTPYLGCDGLPQTGASWVRSRFLAGTVVVPPNAGRALEMMLTALETSTQPPEQTVVPSHPLPSLDDLAKSARTLVQLEMASF